MILIFLSSAWIAGIFLGSKLNLPPIFLLAGLLPLLLLLFTHRRKPIIIVCLGIMLLITAALYSFPRLNTVDEGRLHFYNDCGVTEMKGTVADDPDVRDKNTRLILSIEEIRLEGGWREVNGRALVFVSRYPEYEYGDILKVTGEPTTPQQFNDFDYKEYLAHQSIYTVVFYPSVELLDTGHGFAPLAWVYSLRKGLADNIAGAVPEPQASLAQGIILGMRGNIPEGVSDNFAISGTAHLLAISGLHLGIMAGVLLGLGILLFGKRHYLYVWLAIGAVWLYVLITGLHLPVVRGAIMATLFLLAEALGRQRSAIVALLFAAAVMVGVSPYILGDASFQLSFLAMAGLVFVFPILRNSGRGLITRLLGEDNRMLPIANVVIDGMSATLGALIFVWPVVAHYFGIVSLIGPVSTLLVLPALPAVIILGALTGISGFAVSVVSQGFGWMAWLLLSYMLVMVDVMASPAISAIETGQVGPIFFWLYYAVLMTAIWAHSNRYMLFKNRQEPDIRLSYLPFRVPKTAKWVLVPLMAAAVLMVYTAATMPDDRLHVSFLDVGEGDAILISKGSRQVLVDGGPSPQAIGLELSEHMPYWDRTLDLLVLTHPHNDHMAGLVDVLRRYRVGQVLEPDCYFESTLYSAWHRVIDEKGIDVTFARANQIIDMGDGIAIHVLNPAMELATDAPSDPDNDSVVLRLTTGNISFLLTGDIMRETEWELLRQGARLSSTVLKVAHHGSATSTTREFLAVVNPQVAVISCGSDNKYGHPDADIVCRLEQNMAPGRLFITSANGTIEFITDGEKLWVEVGK